MRSRELVGTVRDDDQDAEPLDAATKEAEYVECRLVGPVRVLDDNYEPGTRRVDECLEHGARRDAVDAHVDERAKGPWRPQPVASARQDALAGPGDERADKRAL